MKTFLQAIIVLFVLGGMSLSAQDCSDLFISKYVEGTVNNRALEIYNPTTAGINLGDYSIARYSNGATDAPSNYLVELPAAITLEPGQTFVAILDKRDTEGVCLDYPTWYGNLQIEVLTDPDTGEVILDDDGNEIEGPVYAPVDECDGSFYAVHGDEYEYNEKYDLIGKAVTSPGAYYCPIYNENRTMYFNGNDAVALVKGGAPAADYSNVIDVIGVIGEDPDGDEFEGIDAWVNIVTFEDGTIDTFAVTRDRTLIRKSDIKKGGVSVAANGDTFNADEWVSLPKNVFDVLVGTHECDCADDPGTGLKQATFAAVNLYPNPSTGNVVNVVVKEAIAQISVHSINGQNMNVSASEQTTDGVRLDVAALQAGLYLVKVKLESGQTVIEKLTISK